MKYKYVKKISNILLLGVFFLFACNKNSEHEKHPDFSKNIIDVSNKVVPIKTNIIFGASRIITAGKYLLLNNLQSLDKGFLLFDKKTFKYITSTGSKGQGPGQIINYRNVLMTPNAVDNKSFYVFDYSQRLLYKYTIDSILNNKKYLPEEILRMQKDRVIGNINTLNDSIFIGSCMRPVNSRFFVNELVQFNIKTKNIKNITSIDAKSSQEARETHSTFALYPTKDKCVQAYRYVDLLTIYDINGNLLCNIYGKLWNKKHKGLHFYKQVKVGTNYIIATYLGDKCYFRDQNKRIKIKPASKLLVFDTKGNYSKTLNIGEGISSFCLDEENNRIILKFTDRDEPLAYLDLKGILD